MGITLLVILVLLLLSVLPVWGHSRKWGYGPMGGLGVLVAIALWLVLTNAI